MIIRIPMQMLMPDYISAIHRNPQIVSNRKATKPNFSNKATCRCTCKKPSIKEVRFNGPATIVFWDDNTKTVARCHEDDQEHYNKEVGISVCICKKLLGNDYFKTIKKYAPED